MTDTVNPCPFQAPHFAKAHLGQVAAVIGSFPRPLILSWVVFALRQATRKSFWTTVYPTPR